jgi:outer membrane lipoprotein-sorting protein
MSARFMLLLLIVSLVLFTGGCGMGDDTGVDAPAADNALEDYSSTLLNSLDKSKKAQIQASLPTIRLQINQFKQDKGRYPESLEEITMPDIPLHLLSYNEETGEVSLQ